MIVFQISEKYTGSNSLVFTE